MCILSSFMISLKKFNNSVEGLFDNKDIGIIYMLYGAVGGFLGLLILYTLISFNVFSVWSWEIGFIDPSTAFAQSLIRLYNFIWSFLVLVLTIVFTLLARIIYLFTWSSRIELNFVINKFSSLTSFSGSKRTFYSFSLLFALFSAASL